MEEHNTDQLFEIKSIEINIPIPSRQIDLSKSKTLPMYCESKYWDNACKLAESQGLVPGTFKFVACVEKTIDTWWVDESIFG